MADILNPKNAQALVDMGLLKPELASKMYTPAVQVPEVVNSSQAPVEQVMMSQPVVEPVAAPIAAPIAPDKDEYAAAEEQMQAAQMATTFQPVRESAQRQMVAPKQQDPSAVLKAIEDKRLAASNVVNPQALEAQAKEELIKKRQADLAKAATLGVTLPKNDTDLLIAERMKDQEKLALDAQKQAAQEIEQQEQEQENKIALQDQRRGIAAQESEAIALQEKANKDAFKAQETEQKIVTQDAAAEQLGNESGWFQPGKIGFIIAAAIAGGAGVMSGRGGNSVLEAYQEQIKNALENKKLNDDQKIAAEKVALEKFKMGLDQQSQKINDAKTMAEIAKLQAETGSKIAELQGKQLVASKGSSQGLTREELLAAKPQNKDRQAFVLGPNGNFYETANDDEAKGVRESKDALDLSMPAIKGLKEIANSSTFNKLTPTARANAESFQTQAVGAMRLLLLGPGTMTDTEQALVRRIISNPTELRNMIFSDAAKSNLDLIEKKSKQAYISKLRSAGVPIPVSKNEVRLENFIRKNAGIDRQEAMTALIKQGLWIDE